MQYIYIYLNIIHQNTKRKRLINENRKKFKRLKSAEYNRRHLGLALLHIIHFVGIRIGNVGEMRTIAVERVTLMRTALGRLFGWRVTAGLDAFLQCRNIVLKLEWINCVQNTLRQIRMEIGCVPMLHYLWNNITTCCSYLIQVSIFSLACLFPCFARSRCGPCTLCLASASRSPSMIDAPGGDKALDDYADNDGNWPCKYQYATPAWWWIRIRFDVNGLQNVVTR